MAKRIYRSRNKMIGGVCAGFAEYFNIDPTIIRLIWAILILVYGIGLLPYFICWIIIPNEPYYYP